MLSLSQACEQFYQVQISLKNAFGAEFQEKDLVFETHGSRNRHVQNNTLYSSLYLPIHGVKTIALGRHSYSNAISFCLKGFD